MATYKWRVVTNFLVVHDTWPHGVLTVHQALVHHGSRVAHKNIWSYRLIEVVRCCCSEGNEGTAASAHLVDWLMAAAARLRHNSDRSRRGRFRCGYVWVIQHFGEGSLKRGRHLPPLHPLQHVRADVYLLLGRHFQVGLMQFQLFAWSHLL